MKFVLIGFIPGVFILVSLIVSICYKYKKNDKSIQELADLKTKNNDIIKKIEKLSAIKAKKHLGFQKVKSAETNYSSNYSSGTGRTLLL